MCCLEKPTSKCERQCVVTCSWLEEHPVYFWIWSLGTKGIHYYAKDNSNEINFILNHIWIWRFWEHTGFRCHTADLYCYVSLTVLPRKILCAYSNPFPKYLALLSHLKPNILQHLWSYRCIYVDIWIQHHVFSIMLTVCSSPPRRWQRVSGARQEEFLFKEADPQSCWGQSFAFLILISYSFIYFQVNTFVCLANNHRLNNYTLIFLFLSCMALAHVPCSSSSNSFLSKAGPRSPSNVAPNQSLGYRCLKPGPGLYFWQKEIPG